MTKVLLMAFLVLLMSSLSLVADVVGPSDALTEHLQRAYDSYRAGESAVTIEGKEQAFNRALRLYTQLEGEPGNGKLYYNIGNTYFQLEQYGWAILYYLRAQNLLPRDDRVSFHLALAQAQQGLSIGAPQVWKQRLLFWHYRLNQAERIQIFAALTLLVFLVLSLTLWYATKLLKRITMVVMVAWTAVLLSLLYFFYLAPVDGVIVKAFGLYHGPREDYALVSDEPFIPGTQVRIQNVVDDGTWLKVIAPNGKVGYVPSDVIRII